MATFSKLNLRGWRQFHEVEIDFQKQVTVLTGENGCGKTTILNTLSQHFGWSLNLVSTPYLDKRRARIWSDLNISDGHDSDGNNQITIGNIAYSNGIQCSLLTSQIVSSQYQLQYQNMQQVEGIHIPSHRPVAHYNHIQSIPTDPQSATTQYQNYQQMMLQFYGGHRGGDNPGKIQKQSIISLAVFGEGNKTVQGNPEMKESLDGFQEVLRKVMPKSLGFKRLDVRMPEVVLVTENGSFSLDAMSGGINAIFGIAWQMHMSGQKKEDFVVTIDEPENHLHPSMQRTLLPSLSDAFPGCRIVVATHSPFIVSSFEEANVYGLSRTDKGIKSQLLDMKDLSGTPNDILRDVLAVDSNLPVWVEGRIERAIETALQLPPEQRSREIMRHLSELGLADAIVEYRKDAPIA